MENFWTPVHAELVITILSVILTAAITIWWDLKKQATTNGERMVRIETMLAPIWDWWNKTNGK